MTRPYCLPLVVHDREVVLAARASRPEPVVITRRHLDLVVVLQDVESCLIRFTPKKSPADAVGHATSGRQSSPSGTGSGWSSSLDELGNVAEALGSPPVRTLADRAKPLYGREVDEDVGLDDGVALIAVAHHVASCQIAPCWSTRPAKFTDAGARRSR